MESLTILVEELKKSDVQKLVEQRIVEFEKNGAGSPEELFSELCFCLLTANFNAERTIKIQDDLSVGFLTLPEKQLASKLKALGHRFPNARADYIVKARQKSIDLMSVLSELKGDELRKWLVENIKGLGLKEASHFLRNVGFKDYAIIDFHIIDLLVKHDLIARPKTLSPNRYLKIENVLKGLGEELDLNISELDLYLWYLETGKILK